MEFDDVINEHLELRRRNAQLEPTLPLDRNRTELTTRNGRPPKHAEAVPEETEEFSPDWLAPSEAGRNRETDSSRLWDVPALFDWGE